MKHEFLSKHSLSSYSKNNLSNNHPQSYDHHTNQRIMIKSICPPLSFSASLHLILDIPHHQMAYHPHSDHSNHSLPHEDPNNPNHDQIPPHEDPSNPNHDQIPPQPVRTSFIGSSHHHIRVHPNLNHDTYLTKILYTSCIYK
jgi:hypothetical protein